MTDAGWEKRLTAAWHSADRLSPTELIALIDALADELPDGSAVGLFERASALDFAGREDLAVRLYREAVAAGLVGQCRRLAVIQLASSLRIVGQPHDSVEILTEELAFGPARMMTRCAGSSRWPWSMLAGSGMPSGSPSKGWRGIPPATVAR